MIDCWHIVAHALHVMLCLNEGAIFLLMSGAAASGKTTVARALAGQLAGVECHDADELVATTIQERWQNLEQWVQRALIAQRHGADFLLTAHSSLGELLSCPSAPQLAGIAASLFDCDDLVRMARIRARGIDPRWPPVQDTFNWASWHRLHAADLQWEAHVIGQWCPFPHHLARWTAWTRDDPRWRVRRVDTSSMTSGETAQVVRDWASTVRSQPVTLGASTCWWEPSPEAV